LEVKKNVANCKSLGYGSKWYANFSPTIVLVERNLWYEMEPRSKSVARSIYCWLKSAAKGKMVIKTLEKRASEVVLGGLFLLVDALGGDVATFDGGDESIAFNESLNQRILLLVVRINLRVNHLLSFKCDGSLDGSVIGGLFFEFYAFLEFHDGRFEGRDRLHFPSIFRRLRHHKIRSELVAHFAHEESNADVAHEFIKSFLRFQSPSAEKRGHDHDE